MDSQIGSHLLDDLQIGVILLDQEGRIQRWNSWMSKRSGLALNDVVGRRMDEALPTASGSRLLEAIDQALRFRLSSMLAPGLNAGTLPLYQKAADRKLDRRMQQLIYVTPTRCAPHACLIQVHDMTATVRRERRLRAQSTQLIATSYRDSLTGVGNRRRFDHDLAKLFKEAQAKRTSLALVMVDVDDFKAYNDRLGHQKGDECLVKVAAALQSVLRQPGDSVSRYGGEEFILLLPETELEAACAIAERLRTRIQGLELPHPASRTGTHVTVSIGITVGVPALDQLAYILIGQADLALYAAKDMGRNRCALYDPGSGDAQLIS